MPTTLTFIGTGGCLTPSDNDTASFIVNGHCLVDCGWYAAINMGRCGYSVADLDYIFITHCHQDHYMGLAGMLFYRQMCWPDMPPVKVVGPAADIEQVVELTRAYLQADRFSWMQTSPEVVPLVPGEEIQVEELSIKTAPTQHDVQGLAYRFADRNTQKQIGFSGDTAYLPALAEHFRGVEVLVYEATNGLHDPEVTEETGHSGVRQSATIAREAQVGRLYLVHVHNPPEQPTEILAAAREIFPETYWPHPGQVVTV